MECSAVIDVLRLLDLLDEQFFSRGKELLERVVAMLSKLLK